MHMLFEPKVRTPGCLAFWSGLFLVAWLCHGLAAQEAAPSAEPVPAADMPPLKVQFEAAAKAFQDGWYDLAEKEAARLIAEFPEAEQLPEIVLLQAQARYHQEKFNGVIELLGSHLPRAGALADQYHYWIAQSHLGSGAFGTAASAYESILRDFPESGVRLQAAYGQAYAQFKAGDIAQAIALLNEEQSAFQKAASSSTNLNLVARGYLLLAEARRAQRDYRAAEQALQQLANRNPGVDIEWQRQILLTRIELADGRPQAALERAGKLSELANSAQNPTLKAQALRLLAEIHERNQPQAAIEAYQKITEVPGVSVDDHREALLKMVDLAATQNQFPAATQRLESFIKLYPEDRTIDLLRLELGELYLKNAFFSATNAATNQTVAVLTNLLTQAREQFDVIISSMTNSSYLGKAYLNKGWTLWEGSNLSGDAKLLQESQAAFQAAAERLTRSEDQAAARFKWADCQFRLKDYPNAIRNYRFVIEQYGDLARVKNQFFEQAYYQIVRAAIELRNLNEAEAAAEQQLQVFPSGAYGDRTLLLLAEALLDHGRAADSRKLLERALEQFPQSALTADLRRAIAKTFVEEGSWAAAIAQYDLFLNTHTNHPAYPEAAFNRAWLYFKSGNETNALMSFTNFVAQFPTNELAPMAQYWVAEHYYRHGDYPKAELNYQSKLFSRQTNATSQLGFQAQLMAGYSAYNRSAYPDARNYLSELINDPRCPEPLLPEAYYLLGEVFVKDDPVPPGTNTLRNFELALTPFNTIVNKFPTNRFAPLALGRLGDCYLQLSRYSESTNAYYRVTQSPTADVAARSQAEVGLGIVLEKMAAARPASERAELLQQALQHYHNVVYGAGLRPDRGERPNRFWVTKAGLAAGRLAESLQRRDEAIKLYQRLLREIPTLQPVWEKRLQQLSGTAPGAQARSGG